MKYGILLSLTLLHIVLPKNVQGRRIIGGGGLCQPWSCNPLVSAPCPSDTIEYNVKCKYQDENGVYQWSTDPTTGQSCQAACETLTNNDACCTDAKYSNINCHRRCCGVGEIMDENGECFLDFSGCPDGFESTTGVQATSPDECVECPQGKFGVGGITCTDCPAGRYQVSTGQAECTNCDFDEIGIGSSGTIHPFEACQKCENSNYVRAGTYVPGDPYGASSDSSVVAPTNVCVWPCTDEQYRNPKYDFLAKPRSVYYVDGVQYQLSRAYNNELVVTGPGTCESCPSDRIPVSGAQSTNIDDVCVPCYGTIINDDCVTACREGTYSVTGIMRAGCNDCPTTLGWSDYNRCMENHCPSGEIENDCKFCPGGWASPLTTNDEGLPERTLCEQLRDTPCKEFEELVSRDNEITRYGVNEYTHNRGECRSCGNHLKVDENTCSKTRCPSSLLVLDPTSTGDERICEKCYNSSLGTITAFNNLNDDGTLLELFEDGSYCQICQMGKYKAMEMREAMHLHPDTTYVSESSVSVPSEIGSDIDKRYDFSSILSRKWPPKGKPKIDQN